MMASASGCVSFQPLARRRRASSAAVKIVSRSISVGVRCMWRPPLSRPGGAYSRAERARAGRSPAQTPQCGSLVQGHVIGLVALDRVLGAVLARVVDVALVVHVSRVHLDDPPAHAPGLRVPA